MLNPYRSLGGLPRGLWVLAFATLVNRAGTMVLPFLALYLTKERGLSAGLAGTVLAAYGATALVTAPLAGRLSDRLGARRQSIATLALSGVCFGLYPLARTAPQLIGATVVLALLAESFRPASLALVGVLAPKERRKEAFALHRLAVNLGMTVGPAVGGLIAGRWFAALFYVDGVTALVSAAVMAFALNRSVDAAPEVIEGSATKVAAAAAHTDRRFLLFLAALLLNALVFFQLDAALPLYLVTDLGMPESRFGLLFTINTLLIIVFEVPLTSAIASWPPNRALPVGALFVAAGFGSYMFASDFWSAAGPVMIWTLGEMILFPASAAFVSDAAPPGKSGEYMGLYSMAFAVAFAVGPVGGVLVKETFGSTALWAAAFGVGLCSAMLFVFVRAREGPDSAPVEIRPEDIASDVAAAMIEALNAELTERYPEDGATHFSLDPDEVGSGRGAFLVAFAGAEPIGCGAVRRLDSSTAEIKRMYVAPAARGSGVGRRMLDALIEQARQLGVSRVVLETGHRQQEAIALYEGSGFERIPAFGEYVDSPLSVCLAKVL